MMNLKKPSILLILLFTVFISCDSRLEISPEDEIASSIVFENSTNIEGVLIGLYSDLQLASVYGIPQLTSDFMSDNVNFIGSFTSLNDIDQFNTRADNGTISNSWVSMYTLIGTANTIINTLPNIETSVLNENLRNQYIAEAKFIRALIFFELVNKWAQPYQFNEGNSLGIPLQLSSFSGGDLAPFQLERSTVNQVHQQIITDLKDAEAILPNSNNFRATNTAAQALLARLYLYRNDWNNALTYADTVISKTTLAPNYSFYNNNTDSTELIFFVINLENDPTVGTGLTDFYNPAPNGRGDAPYSENLFEAFDKEPRDRRLLNLTQVAIDAAGDRTYFTNKYSDFLNNTSLIPILRVTEMYLTRAEANFRLDSQRGNVPLEDINILRRRAGLNDAINITLDNILIERRKELCFEGFRRMDRLRNELNLRNDDNAASVFGANKTIFPIPERELLNNPNITQNPGY